MPVQNPFEGGFRHQLDPLFPWPGKINYDFVAQNFINPCPTEAQKFGNFRDAEMPLDLCGCCHLLLVCELRIADKLRLGQFFHRQ